MPILKSSVSFHHVNISYGRESNRITILGCFTLSVFFHGYGYVVAALSFSRHLNLFSLKFAIWQSQQVTLKF